MTSQEGDVPHIELGRDMRGIVGLATWAPEAREAYDQMAEGIVEHGDGASLRNASDLNE